MPLLTASNLAKLLLRNALHEAIKPSKNLAHILRIHDLQLGPPDEPLDARQAVTDEVLAEPLIDLAQHQLTEPGILALGGVEDGVDEAAALELGGGDALAHDEGLVAPGGAEPLDEGAGGAALGDEAQGGEGCEEECVGRAVDEIGEGGDGGGEADDGPVEADDEDLGVRAEGVADVQVEGGEVLEPVAVEVGVGRVRGGAGDGYVGAAGGLFLLASQV